MLKLPKIQTSHLRYFYGFLGYRMFVSLIFSLFVGLLDGIGLTMFVPLFQFVNGDYDGGGEELGNISFVVDAFESFGLSMSLNSVLFIMLIVFIAKGVVKFFESFLTANYRRHFINSLRVSNLTALSNYSYDAFVHSDSGRIQNTISAEIGKINSAYRIYMDMLQKSTILLVYLILAYSTNPKFALLVTVGGVLTNFLFKTIYKRTKNLSRKVTALNHQFQGLLIQMVAFFKYLKSSGQLIAFGDRIKIMIKRIEDLNYNLGILGSIILAAREPLIIFSVVAAIYIEVNFLGGSLSLVLLSLLFLYRGLSYITAIQTHYNNFLNLTGSLENMKEFMRELQLHKEVNGSKEILKLDQGITLKNVTFSYGDKIVLDDISIALRKNESIAFVGESGSGKTTLVNIMSGLLLPDKGQVLIDGSEINEISRPKYQKRIGYITQEPVIFDDTLFNNVTFWDEKTPENLERFREALDKSSLTNFVNSYEAKEEIRLGNNGIMVSGGQKQRISIAREIYKEIDLLLLDEATSALDAETEQIIQKNIDALKGHYTVVIIAHRLSTVKNVDRIYLLENGKILANGDFDTLMRESKEFARVANLQKI